MEHKDDWSKETDAVLPPESKMTHKVFIYNLYALCEELSLEELKPFCKYPATFISEHVESLHPDPTWIDEKAIHALLFFYLAEETESEKDISRASDLLLSSVNLLDGSGFEFLFFCASRRSRAAFEETSNFLYLDQSLDCMIRFFDVQEPGSDLYIMAAAELVPLYMFYYLSYKAEEPLNEGLQLFSRVKEYGQWESSYGAERTLLMVGAIIGQRYDGFGPEQNFRPIIEKVVSILNLLPSRENISASTPFEVVCLSWLFILAKAVDPDEWSRVLECLYTTLLVAVQRGPISTIDDSIFDILFQALKECSPNLFSSAMCLISLSNAVNQHRTGMTQHINSNTQYTTGDDRQSLWIRESRLSIRYLMHILECLNKSIGIQKSYPTMHRFSLKSTFIHGSTRSSSAHICALETEFIPLATEQSSTNPSSDMNHSDFVRVLNDICKALPADEWNSVISGDAPLVKDFREELQKISPKWSNSEGVVAYLLSYRRNLPSERFSDLEESSRLMTQVDLTEEYGYAHELYRIAGRLSIHEDKESDQQGACTLFRGFIRVQKSGSPLLFMGIVQLLLAELSLALISGKCVSLATATELFRDATTIQGFTSWKKDGRKCLFLGYLLHLRYIRAESSPEVLEQSFVAIKSILDLLPDYGSNRFSSLETFVVSGLMTLARSAYTVDWIDSLDLFRKVIAFCVCSNHADLTVSEDIADRNFIKDTVNVLLSNGIYPFHFAIDNKVQCLIRSSDILQSIIEDISAPPHSLSLSFQIYLYSLRSETAPPSESHLQKELTASWRIIRDALTNKLEKMIEHGNDQREEYQYHDAVYFYCANRKSRNEGTFRTAHHCNFRYRLIDKGKMRNWARSRLSHRIESQWPDAMVLAPPFIGYDAYEVYLPLSSVLDVSYGRVASVFDEDLSLPVSSRASGALTREFIDLAKHNQKDSAILGEKMMSETMRGSYWKPEDVLLENRLQRLKDDADFGPDNILKTLLFRGPERALELIEKSRSRFWSRLMRLRSDFSKLPSDIGKQLEKVANDLENCKTQRTNGASIDDAKLQFFLESEFLSLVKRTREIPGFEGFLLPKTYGMLVAAATEGPIVILLADKSTFAALLVQKTGVDALHLELTNTKMTAMLRVLQRAQKEGRSAAESNHDDRYGKQKDLKTTIPSYDAHLRDLWDLIVYPVLKKLRLAESIPMFPDKRPRIWWCPTGPFSFLPIHAAGTTFGDKGVRYTSDFVLSSYIPNIEALQTARLKMPVTSCVSELEALVTAQPKAPPSGYSPLPKTGEEITVIQSLVPPEQLIRIRSGTEELVSSNTNNNVEDVTRNLEQASILHLACHGHQDQIDPLHSGFELNDGRLTLSTLTSCHTPKAFLAYLSACESAANDLELPDESLNLATAMLYAGFKSVIGTMWSMNDNDGPDVAKTVYRELFKDTKIRLVPRAIPEALDLAARRLRDKGVHPIRWATYIHVGV